MSAWTPETITAFYLGRAAERAEIERAERQRAEDLRAMLIPTGRPGWHDARLRALDVAQRAGEAAYAAERARQGLIPYGISWELTS